MSAYEQRIEAPDKQWQYLLFAAEPYETIAFKVSKLYMYIHVHVYSTCMSRPGICTFLLFDSRSNILCLNYNV